VLTSRGVDVLDVYVGPEGVLTGTSRVVQEAKEKADALARQPDIERREREVERKRAALEVQISMLRAEFEAEQDDRRRLIAAGQQREATLRADEKVLAQRRRADLARQWTQRASGSEVTSTMAKTRQAGDNRAPGNRAGGRPSESGNGRPRRPRRGAEVWQLRLYVAGRSPKSVAAYANLVRICEEHLGGRYTIEVVDLLKNPQLARGDQIVAIPTLVRKLPEPTRKIVGDLSDTDQTLVGLQLRPLTAAQG